MTKHLETLLYSIALLLDYYKHISFYFILFYLLNFNVLWSKTSTHILFIKFMPPNEAFVWLCRKLKVEFEMIYYCSLFLTSVHLGGLTGGELYQWDTNQTGIWREARANSSLIWSWKVQLVKYLFSVHCIT